MADDAGKTPPDDNNGNPPPPAPEFTADDVKGLKDQNAKLAKDVRDRDARLSALEKRFEGVDPDKARAADEEKARLERELAAKDPAKQEEFYEKKLDTLRRDLTGKLDAVAEENRQLKQTVKTLGVTDKVMSEIGPLFNDDVQEDVKGYVNAAADKDDDGVIFFKDENGDPLYLGARLMTAKEYGERLADRKPSLAKPQGSTGTKDATPPPRGRSVGKIPGTYAELMAMPPAMQSQVYNSMTTEQKEAMMKGTPIGQL